MNHIREYYFRIIHKNRKKLVFFTALIFILFNAVAYNHAQAMLNFTQAGERTSSPEDLAFLEKLKIIFIGINVPKPQNQETPEDFGLVYETHDFQINEELNIEGWYLPYEDDCGIVMIFHGYASSKSSLLAEASAFYEKRYSVFMIDFRGSGGSDGFQTTVGYNEAIEVVKSIEYVKTNYPNRQIILYGQSMGAASILRAISEYEINPNGIIIEAVFDEMLSTVENRFDALGLPSFPSAEALLFWGSVQTNIAGFQHNPIDYALAVDMPILMLHGELDPRVTMDQAKSVYKNIPGKDKTFVLFDNAGHESYLGVDPEKWSIEIEGFLGCVEEH